MPASEGDRRDFFVSFNSADRDYAAWIAAELETAGQSVFFEDWDFRPGNNFVLEMQRAAHSADRTIAVLSDSYLKALFTQPEWASFFADDPTGLHRKVIPVRIADCHEDGLLRAIVYIDLVGCDEVEARRRLREGIKRGRAKPESVAFPRGRALGLTAASSPSREPLMECGEHGLPSRDDEIHYLDRLLQDEQDRAARYSPLQGRKVKGRGRESLRRRGADEADIALLRLRAPRSPGEERVPVRDYEDILSAFADWERKADVEPARSPGFDRGEQGRSAELFAILGEPGSGKSTTLRRLAVELARVAKVESGAALPLLAYLGDWTGGDSIDEFLAKCVPEIGWAIEKLSRVGRLVLLLDGLNETPTDVRASKADAVRELSKRLGSKTKIVVSCRTRDYTSDLDLGGDTLTIEPLSPLRVRAVLRHWMQEEDGGVFAADRLFWQLAGDKRLADQMAECLKQGETEESFWERREHVSDSRSLLQLGSNPFLLNMLFLVWESEGALPGNRGDIFARFIDRLLYREGLVVFDTATSEWRRTQDGARLLSGLSELAWGMQRARIEKGRDRGDFGVLTVSGESAAIEALGGETLLRKSLDATLLEGSDWIRFRHQLLQEYFTAVSLLQRMGEMTAAELWPPQRWWGRNGWEETLVLLAGFHPDGSFPVFLWLAKSQPEMAAQTILDSGAETAGDPALLGELHDLWLPMLSAVELEPELRAASGRALSRLNLDDRKGVGVVAGIPDIDWVVVPGGEFHYQGNQNRTHVATFRMARYPITNAQFEVFLRAKDGYDDDHWWEDLAIHESDWASEIRRKPDDRWPSLHPEWNEANHPRIGLNWYRAMAFCSWLSSRLGMAVRLPTELEWEWAAFGLNAGIHASGSQYSPGAANVDETRTGVGPHFLGRTSPVGIYPQSASRHGVMDLVGNVQEWCLGECLEGDRSEASDNLGWLRGGSWKQSEDSARIGYRNSAEKGWAAEGFGFRIACSAPARWPA